MVKRLALCIGIDKYKNLEGRNLQFAKADAVSISKILLDKSRGAFKGKCLFDESATKQKILDQFKRILLNQDLQKDDFVIVYYSGHGGLDNNSNIYLATHDSKTDSSNEQEIDIHSCIHIKELEIILDNTSAGTVVLIVDACFSGASGKALGRITYRADANVVFVGACRSNQASLEVQSLGHGLFTSCFLEGCNQTPTEGEWITLHQLLSFIEEQMSENKSQTIEVTNHSTKPNLLVCKNPLFTVESQDFNKEIQEIFKISGATVSIYPNKPNFFVSEQTLGLINSKTGVMAFDNKTVMMTQQHIDQFLNIIKNMRNKKLLDRGFFVTSHSISPKLIKKLESNLIVKYKLKTDLVRGLMNLDPYLEKIIRNFEKFDPSRPRQPPLNKFYIEPLVNAQPYIKKLQHNFKKKRRTLNVEDKIDKPPVNSEEIGFGIDDDADFYGEFGQDFDLYLDDGENKSGTDSIMKIFDHWLKIGDSRLAILGEYGFGKTVFCKKLAYEMARAYLSGKQKRIPILMDLGRFPRISVDLEALIIDHLSRVCDIKNPSWPAFKTMNNSGFFLLIFDGLDEMAIRTSRDVLDSNMFEIEKLAVGDKSKLILTSRPEYFWSKEEEEQIFEPKEYYSRPSYFRIRLPPFSDEQIKKFLEKRIPLIKTAKHDWKYYYKEISKIYDLPDLSKRPVFLEMIAETLPQLIEEGKTVDRNSLYRRYLDNEIRRQKIEKRRVLLLTADKRFELMKLLAIDLFRRGLDSLSPLEIIKLVRVHLRGSEFQEFEGHISDFLTCSFLKRVDNKFKFSHSTFLDFLIAEKLYEEIINDTPLYFEMSELTKPTLDFLVARKMDERVLW